MSNLVPKSHLATCFLRPPYVSCVPVWVFHAVDNRVGLHVQGIKGMPVKNKAGWWWGVGWRGVGRERLQTEMAGSQQWRLRRIGEEESLRLHKIILRNLGQAEAPRKICPLEEGPFRQARAGSSPPAQPGGSSLWNQWPQCSPGHGWKLLVSCAPHSRFSGISEHFHNRHHSH